VSDVKCRLKRLERDAAAARSRTRPNIFQEMTELMLGNLTLDDVNPDHRPFLDQLYHAMLAGDSASASPQGTQEPTTVPG
jgi:hypothetical protein